MREYVGRRLLYTVVTLFSVATVLFVLFRLMPGDPTAQVLSPALDPSVQARLKHAFGLDLPLWQQYLIYLKNMVTLEWGRSFTTAQPVTQMVIYRFWNTLLLMGAGLCLALAAGVALGIAMAWRRGGPLDIGGTVVSLIVQSAPPFVTGLVLLIFLSYRLGFFPTGGMFTPGDRPHSVFDLLVDPGFYQRIVLPTVTIGAYYLATPMLIMRDNMLEVMGSDFIELARAKGLAPSVIMVRHAARNALLGVVTIMSIMVGFAVGGQVIVENLFSWPGMGQLMVEAASSHDYPVAQATFLMLAVLVIGMNFLTDIVYCYLDPRIKLGGAAAI